MSAMKELFNRMADLKECYPDESDIDSDYENFVQQCQPIEGEE